MHPAELWVPALAGFLLQFLFDHRQRVIFTDTGSPIKCQAVHTRLSAVPVTFAIHIQMRGLIRQTAQGIRESGNRLTGLYTTQPDVLLLEPLVDCLMRRGGAQED